jgi:hypothetical protein
MTQEMQNEKKISEMSVDEIAKYLGVPIWVVQSLMCHWVEPRPVSGFSSCIATDEYNEWSPIRVAILNALPLNSFDRPYDLKVYPVSSTKRLLEFLSNVQNEYECYIGHPQTVALVNKYLPTLKCVRGNYVHKGTGVMVAFVLKNRMPQPGDVNVSEDDLAGYIIFAMPVLDA